MPWIIGGAMLGGALLSSKSAGDAADAQRAGAAASDATQRYFYDTTRADNLPAIQSRNWALEQLKAKLSGQLGQAINPQNVMAEPGYQFGLNQGMGALTSQMNARGMRNSGAALMAGQRYAQDYAGTKYNDAFNREVANRSAQLNPLQSLAGLGQTGASTIASAGQNAANNISANQTGLGNALGASYIAQGNALSGAINQGLGWYANQTKLPGFNGNALSGYTYQNPYEVGPPVA